MKLPDPSTCTLEELADFANRICETAEAQSLSVASAAAVGARPSPPGFQRLGALYLLGQIAGELARTLSDADRLDKSCGVVVWETIPEVRPNEPPSIARASEARECLHDHGWVTIGPLVMHGSPIKSLHVPPSSPIDSELSSRLIDAAGPGSEVDVMIRPRASGW